MSKKKQLKSPWNNLQSAVWVIGIAILFMSGDWWPGILFVVGASILVETFIQVVVPSAVDEEPPAVPAPQAAPEITPTAPAPVPETAPNPTTEPPAPVYCTDLLPTSCPSCGARVRENEVRWVGESSADCAYCASPLILRG